MKCTNPDIGRLITRYEFEMLSDDEKRIFEAHLLECDYCFEDLYSMSQVLETMKKEPEVFIGILEESIKQFEGVTLLGRLREKAINVIYSITSFVFSQLREHRAVAFGAAVSVVVLICSIIILRVPFFKQQPSQELARHPIGIVDSSKLARLADSIQQLKPFPMGSIDTTRPPACPPPSAVASLASLAVIEHVHYAAPLSERVWEERTEMEKLFDRGTKYYEQKNYPQAIAALSEVVNRDSNNAEAQFYLGISYLLMKDIDRGIEHLQHPAVLRDSALKEKAHWYLGNAYLKKNDGLCALHEFETIVKLKGEYQGRAKERVGEIKKRMKKM